MKRYFLVTIAIVGMFSSVSHAWWDTVVTIIRPPPLVKEIEAESCASRLPVEQDAQANGGKGGQAVRLEPGGEGLKTELDLNPGLYQVFVIARSPDVALGQDLMSLELTDKANGQKSTWTMLVVYRESYFAVGQIYFPILSAGKYDAQIRLATAMPKLPVDPIARTMFDAQSLQLLRMEKGKPQEPAVLRPLLVDRLEIRDVLGNCANKAVKTRRMLTSDEELAAIRNEFAGSKAARDLKSAPALSSEQRLARNDELWNKVPDFNDLLSQAQNSPYGLIIGRDRKGAVADAAELYEKSGDPTTGFDGAVLFRALSEKFAAIDFLMQGVGGATNLAGGDTPFTFSQHYGKNVYYGWAGMDMVRLARSYDKLFDAIDGNQALADYVHTRIPWVHTPQDVIQLIDTNLMQAGMDQSTRYEIDGDDLPKAIIPLVEGVNPTSDQMLRTGLFTRICMDLTYRGGVDDQAFCTYNRDGVHYVGSVGYISNDLASMADVLHRYHLAGGEARFDLADARLYPQLSEASSTIGQTHVAGGFSMLVGDARDLHLGRSPRDEQFPSRVLGGLGISVLESGQSSEDPLKKRGVGLTFGLGRGHAHQDTLNLELFAYGCRVAPDLGGRHEGDLRGYPNMRWTKVHNLVEVDEKNFENVQPGSITSATGWNTSFSAMPGSQFMEHQARATSHPDVSLYERQTGMIDVGDEDSYLFDVFRVRGGKIHTYCFHGAPTDHLIVNADLTPATSPEAKQYLSRHREGTQVEGTAPAILQADWPMSTDLQKSYQQASYQPDRPVTTRLLLFGQQEQKIMVGNAWSTPYRYDFPFLYVQGRQSEGSRESVFPAVIEPFAGKAFITSQRELDISPVQKGADGAVAVQLGMEDGRTDLLFASGMPSETVSAGKDLKVAAKFAFLSHDKNGFRQAHLVGGTDLQSDDVSIHCDRAAYHARITGVRYDDRTFTVDQKLPCALLQGAIAGLGGSSIRHEFKLEHLAASGQGTEIVHEKTAKYYQSAVVGTQPDSNSVECEIEPSVYGCDPAFADGTTVTNEKEDRFAKTKLVLGDRWMNLGYPGYRGSWPTNITADEVPDADHDGRRVLKLLGKAGDKDAQGQSLEGKVLLEMEVTRFSPDGETFYFKLPTDPKYQVGGWQFAERWMTNEDGTRRWRATYPGSSFWWTMDRTIAPTDFTDANGDGKSKLSAFLFGPGDELTVDTAVYLSRQTDDTYLLRANVPCTISLPKGSSTGIEISTDSQAYRALEATANGAGWQFSLKESDLGSGSVHLRMKM